MPAPRGDPYAVITPAAAQRLMESINARPTEGATTLGIPGYIIDRPVGHGGAASVYRAFREGSDRPVALKVLRWTTSEAALKRAWREFDLLESLRLPNVPRILDYGVHEGRLYLAEEFIEGRTLEDHCAALDATDLRSRVQLLAQAARGVQALHERGVIHRDLKPTNILVTPHGDVMIVDFGLAFQSDAPVTTMSQTETPLGTPAYMAPEQARGERQNISTRSDIYSLGATACRILTGHTPHDTNTSIHEAIRRVAFEPAREPRNLRPDLPRPLGAIIAKACEHEPARRYASAADLATDFERYLRGEPVSATMPGTWQRLSRWAGRHPVVVTAMMCAAVILVSATTFALTVYWARHQPAAFSFVPPTRSLETCLANELPTTAILVSAIGQELARVGDAPPYQVRAAKLIRRDGELLAVVSVDGDSEGKNTRGQLWICDSHDLSTPLRATSPDPTFIMNPPYPSGYEEVGAQESHHYTIRAVCYADVFPDVPGTEIIAVHWSCNDSPMAIRVYDLDLNVHFEAWHFGHICEMRWWAEAGMLVVTAERHGIKTNSWSGMGIVPRGHPADRNRPKVAFGLAPRRNERIGWVYDSVKPAPNGTVRFYKALWMWPLSTGEINLCIGDRKPNEPMNVFVLEIHSGNKYQLYIRPDGTVDPERVPWNDDLLRYFEGDLQKVREETLRFQLVDWGDWPARPPSRDGE